jgi:hypothetical protein
MEDFTTIRGVGATAVYAADPGAEQAAQHFRRLNAVLAKIRYEGSKQQRIDRRNRALDRELNELDDVWRDISASRKRTAIYRYLAAVLQTYRRAKARGRTADLIRNARQFSDKPIDPGADAFTIIVRATARRRRPDAKQISKLVRVLRYSASFKKAGISLQRFARERGGINGICRLYTSRLGRGKAKRKGK